MVYVMRRLQLSVVLLALAVMCTAQELPSAFNGQHMGRVQDWTSRQLVFSGGLKGVDLNAIARTEPRILFRLAERNLDGRLVAMPARPIVPSKSSNPSAVSVDWSVNLGAGVVPANMYPGKFNFDINGTPNCVRDYVAYGLNVAGALNGQANLIGINRLYSGNPPSFCNATTPLVNWAYNTTTAGGGAVRTSIVISLDGLKIAFVESTATQAIFHVLTWKAGEGTAATTAANPTLNGACTLTSSCLKSVTFSTTATDTLSSPWVDFATDKGFVGGDDGKIYRISCVFTCALNSNPTVDWTFTLPVAGTGGAAPMPNGPVYNNPYQLLFVGDQLGEMWTLNAGGPVPSLFAGPVMIGGGGCTTTDPPGRTGTPNPCTSAFPGFGLPDSVILDARGGSEKIFMFTGNDGTVNAGATVAQANQDLTGIVRVHVGRGRINLHTGAFDNEYWGDTPTTGKLFLCGTNPANSAPFHYWIGFSNYPTIDSVPAGSTPQVVATTGVPCSPYTEFFNPNIDLGGIAGHHDLLMSGTNAATTNGFIVTNDISTGAVTGVLNSVNYPLGISGIIIDNASTQPQASSMYFSTQRRVTVGTCANQRCAVKLTQLNLQ
jgi:hypothetical protein